MKYLCLNTNYNMAHFSLSTYIIHPYILSHLQQKAIKYSIHHHTKKTSLNIKKYDIVKNKRMISPFKRIITVEFNLFFQIIVFKAIKYTIKHTYFFQIFSVRIIKIHIKHQKNRYIVLFYISLMSIDTSFETMCNASPENISNNKYKVSS